MNDDDCIHAWGEAEMCETRHGNVSSPTCRHCGAVKLEVERRRVEAAPRPMFAAVRTNTPPANVPVQAFQTEFFTDL